MARIDRFTSRAQAELACGLLTAHGLRARVSGDDAGGVHPDIPFGIGGTAIVVPDDELAEATAILDAELSGGVEADDGDGPGEASRGTGAWRLAALVVIAVVVVALLVTRLPNPFA